MLKRHWLIFIASLLIALAVIYLVRVYYTQKNYYSVLAVTGATPKVLSQPLPENIALTINGLVSREYKFSSQALAAFATSSIRTKEMSAQGEFIGAYTYVGIPLYNILEGIEPKKPEQASFNKPLDLIVSVKSATGKIVNFTYNELLMTDDSLPVTLAFYRQEILPYKDPDQYNHNKYKDNIKGLKLIAPRDPDTARYLDDVVEITIAPISLPEHLLPKVQKGLKCDADSLNIIDDKNVGKANYDNVKKNSVSNWIRIGHGQGYKSISKASGFNLRSFLKKNFPDYNLDDYFLFVGCDGYRALFSARELFLNKNSESYLILDQLDGQLPMGKIMLAAIDDFFVDRDVWGLSHVVRISQ
ncbi:MAG: hypothetical protein ABH859_08630 [Pseudomonadota bacterium]